ncbi:hypothetical protein [Methanosarcina sp. KYL-1]|nr:hypothetical protein [Methanosarcina sp. KYL-1]
MARCEHCGKEVENTVKIKGQKLCTECVVEVQKNMDLDSLGYSACI